MDELAEVRLCGLLWPLNGLQNHLHSILTQSSNCISEVSCSLSSWSLLFKFVTNLFKPWEILSHEWELSLFIDSILISTPYLPCRQQVVTSNTGPILVFPRIQPFGSIELSSLGNVYSRQATDSVNCENFFSVFRHEVLSDVNCSQESCIKTKFAHSVLLWQLFNSFSISLQEIFFLCTISQKYACLHHTLHEQWVGLSVHNKSPVRIHILHTFSATAPYRLSWFTERIVLPSRRNSVSTIFHHVC